MKTQVLTNDGLNQYHNLLKEYISSETEITSQDVIDALGYTPSSESTIPIFSFEIVDGDLIMHYADDSSAPLAYINEDGELIMSL